MPYVIEDMYLAGIPQTALVGGLASRGIALHWTAGGTGLAGAKGTAQYFIDRADRNASYHELWWWDAAMKTFGVLRIVPATRAAHSMNPNPPTWAPNAEVRRILGDKIGDPNAAAHAPSFAGMPADLVAAMADPAFIGYATQRIRELLTQEDTIKVDRPLFNHGWGQPTTRYDAGDALIPAIYARLYTPVQEEDMPTLTTYALETIRIDANAAIRGAPTTSGDPLFLSGRESSAVRVGTLVNAESEWSVYYLAGRKTWAYTAKQNVLKVEPYQNTVEVPTGITPEQLASLQYALDSANKRTAAVKTAAVSLLRKAATVAEADAKNVETL